MSRHLVSSYSWRGRPKQGSAIRDQQLSPTVCRLCDPYCMYFAAALASSMLSGERRILVQSRNGRQARGERGAFRRLIMDWHIHFWPNCAGLHAAMVSPLLLLMAVAFFPLLEARRYTSIVASAWMARPVQSTIPLLAGRGASFFVFRAELHSHKRSDACLALPERDGSVSVPRPIEHQRTRSVY